MSRFLLFFLLGTIAFFCTQCGINNFSPIDTIQNQTERFHSMIEDTISKKYGAKNYRAIGYGELKVFKPEVFVQLDSVYRIKKKYLDKNDLRGLKQSGIEEVIPGYRAAAQQEVDKIQYEIEHLYQVSANDSLHIFHDFFLFNYKDSLISITPFYDFIIPERQKNLYYAYQFEYHFTDDRYLYISKDEQDFLRFFKSREIELVGDDALQKYMENTLNVMETAKRVQSVDFEKITRQLAIDFLSRLSSNYTIEKFGTLYVTQKNDIVQNYELEVQFQDMSNGEPNKITFIFSPYLKILEVK